MTDDYDFTKDDSPCWKEMLEEIEAPTKEELQQRIDEAIEYIEIQQKIFKDYDVVVDTQLRNILDTLKGIDKE